MKISIYTISLVVLLAIFSSCEDKQKENEFKGNNKKVLKNWAENIIIPAYGNYQSKVNKLVDDAKSFKKNISSETFNNLRNSWLSTYKAYQKVLIFDIKKANSIHFLGITNTYPCNIDAIQNNIDLIAQNKANEVDLEPSFVVKKHTYQGLPALDYLLFNANHTLDYYKTEPAKYTVEYIVMLTEALQKNINSIVNYWNQNKEEYINDTDNSVTGAYAATINAFLRTYEKDIRAAKVGYATGAIKAQNNKPAPEVIEAYYNGKVDKELLKMALVSSQNFFNGKHFSNNKTGESLHSILDSLGHKDLASSINEQYNKIYTKIESMPKSLKTTAIDDNASMKSLYDVIQVNVAYYKTQMMAALKVQVGYQDTDGD